MAVKFNEYWNIIPDKMDEYTEFMQQYRIPTMNHLGINIVCLWSVLVGPSPQIISEGIVENFEHTETALKSDQFYQSNLKLLSLVRDYRSKIMVSSGRFSHLPRSVEKGAVKFSQYWDIIPGMEKHYDHFIRSVHYPAMDEIGIQIGGEWKVLIGESPHVFYEGRSVSLAQLLTALENKNFKIMKNELLKFVYNYSSRILTYHAVKDTHSHEYTFNIIE